MTAEPPRSSRRRDAPAPPLVGRSLAVRAREKVGAFALVLPGVAWLALFFLVPLVIIFVVSLGTRDASGNNVVLDHLGFQQLRRGDPPGVPARLRELASGMPSITTVLSLGLGYPIAYWISRYGGRRKVLLLILVMLPFWTSYLIRTYAWMIILRDNGVLNGILRGVGPDRRTDRAPQHRHLGDPGHDLRLPAVRDPAAVRVDRPARPEPRPGRPGPVRQRPCRVPARDLAADDARHDRGGAPHVHPGDGRLRDAGPPRRRPDHDRGQARPGAVHERARLAVRLGPRRSC